MNRIRIKTVNIALSISLLFCLTCCISNTDIVEESKSYPLTVSVNDAGFTSASNLKATESEYKTVFAKGDQIGLYVVDASGSIEAANICLTYDSVNWNYPDGTAIYYDSTATTRYFAYYPYQSTLTGAPTTTSTATDAATFFADAISDWTPATDQSTEANYTASDLMIGKGTVGSLLSNATRPLTFSMSHQMGLVDMRFPYCYLSTDNTYAYTLGLTCSGFKPYRIIISSILLHYRYIIKPATTTSIEGYYCPTTTAVEKQRFSTTLSVAAGTYQLMNVDSSAIRTSHTLAIGDYYLNDGSLIPNATTNSYLLEKAIGVVFDTVTSANDQIRGWTHGYAMALTNAPTNTTTKTCIWGPESEENGNTFTDSYGTYTYSYYYNEYYTDFTTDKDGYCETQTIKNNHTLSSDNYPAFYYALNYGTSVESGTTAYAAPSGSSGWFLPSIGQWYDIFINLGGMTSTPTSSSVGTCIWSNSLSGTSSYAYQCTHNINAYLTSISTYSDITPDTLSNNSMSYTDSSGNIGSYNTSSSGGEGYWTSSEYSSTTAGHSVFLINGETGISPSNKATGYYLRNRPVIAF